LEAGDLTAYMEATIPGAVGVGPPSAALDYEHPKSWALNLDWLS